MSKKEKLTLSEIMARPTPQATPEQEAELKELEALFSPENQQSQKYVSDVDKQDLLPNNPN